MVDETQKQKIENILKTQESKKEQGSAIKDTIKALLPEINKFQNEGYTLEQIYNAIVEGLEIQLSFNTFRIYLRDIRKKEMGLEKLPKGPVPKKRE